MIPPIVSVAVSSPLLPMRSSVLRSFLEPAARIGTLALLAGALLLPGRPAAARTWHLNAGGSGDTTSVRAAAEAAVTGDTLLLGPGTHDNDQTVTIFKKTLVILGAGQDQTILEGPIHGNVVYLQGPNNDTEIRDLTIADGHADILHDIGSDGGGIHAEAANFTLRRVRITRCTAGVGGGLGGAIFMSSQSRSAAAPGGGPGAAARRSTGRLERPAGTTATYITIDECLIDHNFSGSEGGGIYAENALFVIQNCRFEENDTVDGGGLKIFDSYGNVTGCLFLNNHAEFYGGGVKVEQGLEGVPVNVSGNTFYGNRTERGGSGAYLFRCISTSLDHNIFVRQDGESGDAYSCGLPGDPIITCNLTFDNKTTETLDCPDDPTRVQDDPQFCSAATGDFRLCTSSPALKSDCGAGIGAFGIGCTGAGCATAVQLMHWGTLKSLYGR